MKYAISIALIINKVVKNKMSKKKIVETLMLLVGAKAWGEKLLDGSVISVNFGEPRTYERDVSDMRGQWRLLTLQCEWRLEKDEEILAGSEDARDHINGILRELNEQVLENVDINLHTLDVSMIFTNSIRLRLFPLSYLKNSTALHWILYLPSDYEVLEFGPGKTWNFTNYSSYK